MVTKVKKYGGSVLRGINGFTNVVDDILYERKQGYSVLPVVSAPGPMDGSKKMTDKLVEIYNNVRNGHCINTEMDSLINDFNELFENSPSSKIILGRMNQFLELSQEGTSTYDIFVGSGESISGAVLKDRMYHVGLDGFITMNGRGAGIILNELGEVLISESLKRMKSKISPESKVILEGFTGLHNGHVKIMERNGTDITAALAAYTLQDQGENVELWILKDYPITRTDPRIVENPKYLKKMCYEEASLMAWGGVEVVHPDAISIASIASLPIPIFVGDFESQNESTKIYTDSETSDTYPIATVTAAKMYVLDIFDERMAGVRGYYKNVINSLDKIFEEDETYVSIDYSSSVPPEIVFVLDKDVKDLARRLKDKLYDFEIKPPKLEFKKGGIVSIIGQAMKNRIGTLEDLTRAMAEKNINILTTFHGLSTPNIAFCISLEDIPKAVHAIYNISLQENLGL